MRRLLLAGLLLSLLLVPATPAQAGRVLLQNNYSYGIRFLIKSYLLGFSTHYFTCLNHGDTDVYDDTICSIGEIQVEKLVQSYGNANKECGDSKVSYHPIKTITVPGTWLPHRRFTVTVNSDLTVEMQDHDPN